MKIKIHVRRSETWVSAQRLQRGENVPDTIVCEVEVQDLSEQCRRILMGLTIRGMEYPETVARFPFTDQFAWSGNGCGYGNFRPQVDADTPTVAEIDAAILLLDQQLAVRRADWEEREENRQAELRQEERKKAAKVAARELLADEFAALQQVSEACRTDRKTLANFLHHVPLDALRGTLKDLCRGEAAVGELRAKIEDASPEWIFINRDDDDDAE